MSKGTFFIMLADTAIMGNSTFTHYCHKINGLMVLRIHHPNCPLCLQKNPDYIQNKLSHAVIDFSTGKIRIVFADMEKAIQYIQKRPFDNLALEDVGFVE